MKGAAVLRKSGWSTALVVGAVSVLVPGWWASASGQTLRSSEPISSSQRSSPSQPSSSASSPPAWPVVSSPNAGAVDILAGVSCVSSSFCMAVGTYTKTVSSADLALFEEWDGEQWSIIPGSPDAPNAVQMTAISCASDDLCLAVGTVDQTDIVTERWDGKAWSLVPSVDPSGSYIAVGVKGLACTTSGTCVTVGDVLGGGRYKTFIESWHGSWVIEPSPDPGPYAVLTSVACTTNGGTLCVAGGEYGQSEAATTHAFLAASHGSGWSVATTVDAIPANASTFSGVSCSSDKQCAAVGTYDVAGGGGYLLDDNWNGSAWKLFYGSRPTAVDVSCLSATNCDDLGTSGYIWNWNGSSWTQVSGSQSGGSTYFSLSCAPGLCVAVGNAENHGATETSVEEGCSAARSSSADLVVVDTASTPSCGLNVSVKAIAGGQAGLGWYAPVKEPLFYGTKGGSQTEATRCVSGCIDLLIKVTDPNHLVDGKPKAVGDADVDVSVTPVPAASIAPMAKGVKPGVGYLCLESNPERCGSGPDSDLPGLHTDGSGQVVVRYWVPGLWRSATVKFTARASTCDTSVCTSGNAHGERVRTLTVAPNIVYNGSGTMDVNDQEELADAAEKTGYPGLSLLLHYLASKDPHGLTVSSIEDDLTQWFFSLFKPAFPTTRLGSPEMTDRVPLPLTGAYQNFVDAVAAPPAIPNIQTSSVLWRLGYTLRERHADTEQRAMTLTVYEVSYCEQGELCGPGWTSSGSKVWSGIHQYLEFNIRSSEEDGLDVISTYFVTPYDAAAWLAARSGSS